MQDLGCTLMDHLLLLPSLSSLLAFNNTNILKYTRATEEMRAAPKANRPPSARACEAALNSGCACRNKDRLRITALKSFRNAYTMSPVSDTCTHKSFRSGACNLTLVTQVVTGVGFEVAAGQANSSCNHSRVNLDGQLCSTLPK